MQAIPPHHTFTFHCLLNVGIARSLTPILHRVLKLHYPKSQPFYQRYKSILPTSLTYIVLINQRLITLETCCGIWYGLSFERWAIALYSRNWIFSGTNVRTSQNFWMFCPCAFNVATSLSKAIPWLRERVFSSR